MENHHKSCHRCRTTRDSPFVGCSKCPKSYHAECAPVYTGDTWICRYCRGICACNRAKYCKRNANELTEFRVEDAFDIIKQEISEENPGMAELWRKAQVCIRWFWKFSEEKEEQCMSQSRQISEIQHQYQLAAATEKLKMTDLSSSDIRTEYEEQKRVVSELQDRLRAAENQLLKSTELKGKTVLEQKPRRQ